MTTTMKKIKTWCGVCNTTKHDAKKCAKVEGYDIILCQFLDTIKANPDSVRDYRAGKYEKTFLKYALSSLRLKGVYIAETHQYIYADSDGQMKQRQTYDELVNTFNVALFEIRIKVRDVMSEAKKCPICMETMTKKTTCTTVCKHTFCSDCYHDVLGKTLKQKRCASCPLCRATIVNIM
jgi:hypothetical protein